MLYSGHASCLYLDRAVQSNILRSSPQVCQIGWRCQIQIGGRHLHQICISPGGRGPHHPSIYSALIRFMPCHAMPCRCLHRHSDASGNCSWEGRGVPVAANSPVHETMPGQEQAPKQSAEKQNHPTNSRFTPCTWLDEPCCAFCAVGTAHSESEFEPTANQLRLLTEQAGRWKKVIMHRTRAGIKQNHGQKLYDTCAAAVSVVRIDGRHPWRA
jgi:hypothetical protein